MENTDIAIKNLLDRQKIIALDDRVIVEFRNLTREYRIDYKYSDLKPRIVRGKSGDPGWTDVGKYLISTAAVIAFGAVFVFPEYIGHLYYKLSVIGLAVLALLAFSLRMIKYDKVWFDDKDGNTAFIIKLTKENLESAEQLISFIGKKIEQAEPRLSQLQIPQK